MREIGACSNLEEVQEKLIFVKPGLSQSASQICSPALAGRFPSCPRRLFQKYLDVSEDTSMFDLYDGNGGTIDDDYGIQRKSKQQHGWSMTRESNNQL